MTHHIQAACLSLYNTVYCDTISPAYQAFSCHDTMVVSRYTHQPSCLRLSRYTCCIVTHSQTKLPLVTIQFVVSRHGPPACLVSAPVMIQSLYRDTPHPGCPYCDTTVAPAMIKSLYRDTAFPPGQASLPASVSRYKWLYCDPVPKLKIGSSPAI